jgi:alpha-L-fucosidase
VEISEYTKLGERLDVFYIDAFVNGAYRQQIAGNGVGVRVIVKLAAPVTTSKLRIRFENATASPIIRWIAAYKSAVALA